MRVIIRVIIFALFLVPVLARAEVASCYGPESGKQTASGEPFNWQAMTAAMCSLQGCNSPRSGWVHFGTYVKVTYAGRSIVVRITDRGPFVRGRVLDLSLGACRRIGLDKPGAANVTIEFITKESLYVPRHGDWGSF